jgi:hypothetical protein
LSDTPIDANAPIACRLFIERPSLSGISLRRQGGRKDHYGKIGTCRFLEVGLLKTEELQTKIGTCRFFSLLASSTRERCKLLPIQE